MTPSSRPGYKKKAIGFKHRFEVKTFDERGKSNEISLTKSRSEVYTAVKSRKMTRRK